VTDYIRPAKDLARNAAEARKHDKKVRHKTRPCGNPPATPTGVVLTFHAVHDHRHIYFTGKVKWNEVTLDTEGHGTGVKDYEVQLRATNSGGTPIETQDNDARIRMHRAQPVHEVPIEAATASGGVANYTTRRVHGFAAGDKVKVSGMKPVAYNGNFTVATVPSTTHFTATIGSTPADATVFGTVKEDQNKLQVITRRLPRPKTWYWQARVRCSDTDCTSNFSDWTSPGSPTTASRAALPAVTGLVKDNSIARRIKWTWDDPNDDDTPAGWQVTIKARGAIVEGPTLVRQARYVYRVGEADKGIAHTAEIVPFDDMGAAGTTSSLDGTEDGTIDGDILTPGTVDITPFASSIRPVAIVAELPSLPNATYPVGACVVLTTNGKLYRNVADAWTAAVPTADLTGTITGDQIAANTITAAKIAADTITAGQIAAGAISASEIAAGAVTATKIAAGIITATHISAGGLTGITITGGMITAPYFASGTSGSYLIIDSVFDKTSIEFVSSGVSTKISAVGGGIRIASATSGKVSFYGSTPITQPVVTGVRSGGTALTSLINKLATLGLIHDDTT